MTEIELNEQLAALLENFEKEPICQRRTGRRYRRRKGREKSDRLLAIIQTARYGPHRGYVDCDFEGKTLLHTGYYIKYPKNSKCQRWLKRVSSKKVRPAHAFPKKETATAGCSTTGGRCIKENPAVMDENTCGGILF